MYTNVPSARKALFYYSIWNDMVLSLIPYTSFSLATDRMLKMMAIRFCPKRFLETCAMWESDLNNLTSIYVGMSRICLNLGKTFDQIERKRENINGSFEHRISK